MKNIHAYRIFGAYRRGWNAGWAQCGKKRSGLGIWNSYTKGYRDGCSSARGVWRKNLNAYRRFRAYRNGWIAGKRNCGVKRISSPASGAVGPTTTQQILDTAVQSDKTANEISRILYSAKEYLQQNYVKKPLPKAIELQIHTLNMDDGYAMVDVTPVFSDGTEVATEYLPDVPFQFCMKRDPSGGWAVIYDLSHSGDLRQDELRQIRREFPKDFPTELLPEYWKAALNDENSSRMLPERVPGETEMIDDRRKGNNPAVRGSEVPLTPASAAEAPRQ